MTIVPDKPDTSVSVSVGAKHTLQEYCPKEYKTLRGIGVCTYPRCDLCTLTKPKKEITT